MDRYDGSQTRKMGVYASGCTGGERTYRNHRAVFDFFAGTVERAPVQWQEHGLEWLYRLIKEPRRMWRRYIIGNALFLWNITKEKFSI